MPRDVSGANWTAATTSDKTELTIDASGDITATLPYHTVDTASDDASDNLDGITPSVKKGSDADGYLLLIRPVNDARSIVVRHNQNAAAAKNILLNGDADITLDDEDDCLFLMYDINLDTNGAWIQVAKDAGAGSGQDLATDTLRAALGDLVKGTGDNAADILTVGADHTVLVSNGTDPSYSAAPPLADIADTHPRHRINEKLG